MVSGQVIAPTPPSAIVTAVNTVQRKSRPLNKNPLSIFSDKQIKDHNRDAWDQHARTGGRFAQTASAEDYQIAAKMLLQNPWLPDSIRGLNVLNLASGGGGQSGLLASQGAIVTVVDISPAMLDNDLRLARNHGFDIRTIAASMDHMPMLKNAEFDLVLHPVSTCYLPNIQNVFDEVARVTKPGAIYVSHHKQPISMQADAEPTQGNYPVTVPYGFKGPLPPVSGKMHREDDTLEFLHSWEDILGGLCRAGFHIEDFKEPKHGNPDAPPGSFAHRSQFIPPFMSIKAIRKDTGVATIII